MGAGVAWFPLINVRRLDTPYQESNEKAYNLLLPFSSELPRRLPLSPLALLRISIPSFTSVLLANSDLGSIPITTPAPFVPTDQRLRPQYIF